MSDDDNSNFTWGYVFHYTSDGNITIEKQCGCGHSEDDKKMARYTPGEIEGVLKDWVDEHDDDTCPNCDGQFAGEY